MNNILSIKYKPDLSEVKLYVVSTITNVCEDQEDEESLKTIDKLKTRIFAIYMKYGTQPQFQSFTICAASVDDNLSLDKKMQETIKEDRITLKNITIALFDSFYNDPKFKLELTASRYIKQKALRDVVPPYECSEIDSELRNSTWTNTPDDLLLKDEIRSMYDIGIHCATALNIIFARYFYAKTADTPCEINEVKAVEIRYQNKRKRELGEPFFFDFRDKHVHRVYMVASIDDILDDKKITNAFIVAAKTAPTLTNYNTLVIPASSSIKNACFMPLEGTEEKVFQNDDRNNINTITKNPILGHMSSLYWMTSDRTLLSRRARSEKLLFNTKHYILVNDDDEEEEDEEEEE